MHVRVYVPRYKVHSRGTDPRPVGGLFWQSVNFTEQIGLFSQRGAFSTAGAGFLSFTAPDMNTRLSQDTAVGSHLQVYRRVNFKCVPLNTFNWQCITAWKHNSPSFIVPFGPIQVCICSPYGLQLSCLPLAFVKIIHTSEILHTHVKCIIQKNIYDMLSNM